MAHRKRSKRSKAKTILRLADLEQSKNAVLDSLGAAISRESYGHAIDEFIGWYCSEPRLAFNRSVVLRYRLFLEQKDLAPSTINVRLAAVRRLAYEASDTDQPITSFFACDKAADHTCRLARSARNLGHARRSARPESPRLFSRGDVSLVTAKREPVRLNSIDGQLNRRWEQVFTQNHGGWEDACHRALHGLGCVTVATKPGGWRLYD